MEQSRWTNCVHEAGHATMAQLLGRKVYEINIGEEIWDECSTHIDIAGLTQTSESARLIYAAGVGAELAVLGQIASPMDGLVGDLEGVAWAGWRHFSFTAGKAARMMDADYIRWLAESL